jgi:hypothetical protein
MVDETTPVTLDIDPQATAAAGAPAAPESVTATPAEPAGEPKTEEDVEATAQEPPSPAGDTRTPTQKRIDRAVRGQREAERFAAAAREEAARLKGRLEVLEQQRAAPADDRATTGTLATANALPDDPKDPRPKVETFESYEDYVLATGAWAGRQTYKTLRAQERAEEETRRVQQETERKAKEEEAGRAKVVSRAKAFAADHPDYDDVVTNPDFLVSNTIAEVLLDPDNESGPALAYALGRNLAETARLSQLPPRQALMELGRFQDRHVSRPAVAAVTRAATTQAPPPINPVRGAAMPAAPAQSDMMSYYARRRAEGAPFKDLSKI